MAFAQDRVRETETLAHRVEELQMLQVKKIFLPYRRYRTSVLLHDKRTRYHIAIKAGFNSDTVECWPSM